MLCLGGMAAHAERDPRFDPLVRDHDRGSDAGTNMHPRRLGFLPGCFSVRHQ
jgi:hypothetical protein